MTEHTARDLIQRLVDALEYWQLGCGSTAADACVIQAARAYLAANFEPAADGPAVPDGGEPASVAAQPTDDEPTFTPEEVEMIAAPWSYLQPPLPTPIPLSERLPTEADCDAEGRCWFTSWDKAWMLEDRTFGCNPGRSHWLPAHALPLPEEEP